MSLENSLLSKVPLTKEDQERLEKQDALPCAASKGTSDASAGAPTLVPSTQQESKPDEHQEVKQVSQQEERDKGASPATEEGNLELKSEASSPKPAREERVLDDAASQTPVKEPQKLENVESMSTSSGTAQNKSNGQKMTKLLQEAFQEGSRTRVMVQNKNHVMCKVDTEELIEQLYIVDEKDKMDALVAKWKDALAATKEMKDSSMRAANAIKTMLRTRLARHGGRRPKSCAKKKRKQHSI